MTTRPLFQKFPSWMSGSRSLFRSYASASASAGAQVKGAASEGGIRTLTDLSNGAAIHPWTALSNNGGIHACENSSRALTNVSHRAVVRPGTAVHNNNWIHACAFVDSVGVKRALSSDVCTRNKISRAAKMAAWAAKWDAKSAAWQAQQASWEAEIEAKTADFNKFLRRQAWLWGFACFCWIFGGLFEDCATCNNGKSSSPRASTCGN